tara:strand:+ start:973 stop:1443 length:471 start_codon:yes stop_codon:yes gene_type:complete
MSINENTSYQYIRLNDGKELLAMVNEMGESLEMYMPMNLMCKPSITGPGVTIHLGPAIPFTTDDFIIVSKSNISYRASISKQFVSLYDEAVTNWIDLRDDGDMKITTQQQEDTNELNYVKRMISNFKKDDIPIEDYELEDEYMDNKDLPNKKDIIH